MFNGRKYTNKEKVFIVAGAGENSKITQANHIVIDMLKEHGYKEGVDLFIVNNDKSTWNDLTNEEKESISAAIACYEIPKTVTTSYAGERVKIMIEGPLPSMQYLEQEQYQTDSIIQHPYNTSRLYGVNVPNLNLDHNIETTLEQSVIYEVAELFDWGLDQRQINAVTQEKESVQGIERDSLDSIFNNNKVFGAVKTNSFIQRNDIDNDNLTDIDEEIE